MRRQNAVAPATPVDIYKAALFTACRHGHTAVATALLRFGATERSIPLSAIPRSATYCPNTPLFIASQSGHVDIVRAIVAMDETAINDVDAVGETALWVACANANRAVVGVLLAAGADVDLGLPLHTVCEYGDYTTLNLLIAGNANLETVNCRGETPLCVAVRQGYTNTVSALIAANANIEHRTHTGQTPFSIACVHGHPGILKTLIAANADFGKITTASMGVVKTLVKANANRSAISICTGDIAAWLAANAARTAAEICVRTHDHRQLRVLLRGGASPPPVLPVLCKRTAALCCDANAPWSHSRHFLYGAATRSAIKTLLRVAERRYLPCWQIVILHAAARAP
jgi:ankyrin repeat protein